MSFTTVAALTFAKDRSREDAQKYLQSMLDVARDLIGQPIFNLESGRVGKVQWADWRGGQVVIGCDYTG